MIAGRDSLAEHFTAAVPASGESRLHMAAHSHHPWPDVTRQAHLRSWEVAAEHLDDKWVHVLERELPRAQHHVATRLDLAEPANVVFAQNTHELLVRICSALPMPMRVLTTDAEFHSAARQLRRWVEAGWAVVDQVPAEPFETFPDRFVAAMRPEHDLVLLSEVFYNSGYVVPEVAQVVASVPDERTYVVVDGYHAFMALPTSVAPIRDRAFYLAGGYKYAMAGEGACFAVVPPGYAQRPVNTGWFAAYSALADGVGSPGQVPFPLDGQRLAGSTFDPTGLFRFNAVQDWLDGLGVDVAAIHDHVSGLQEVFRTALEQRPGVLAGAERLPGQEHGRGHFLTYRTVPTGSASAGAIATSLAQRGVVVDHRGDRLRFGFGVYHDAGDAQRLAQALRDLS